MRDLFAKDKSSGNPSSEIQCPVNDWKAIRMSFSTASTSFGTGCIEKPVADQRP